MNLLEQKLSREDIFKGRIIDVKLDTVLLPNGKEATREVILHPGGVCIVPITEKGDIVMVRQFRYPYNQVLLEIPAGKLEYGEDPFECGKRELLEEIGAVAESYTSLGKLYPTPAYDSETIHIYMAENLTFSEQNLDEDEFLEVLTVPFDKAVEMIMNGEISDAKTQIGILKANLLRRGVGDTQTF